MTDYISFFITFLLIYLLTLKGSNTQKEIEGRVELKIGKIQPIIIVILMIIWIALGILSALTYIDERDISILILSVVSFVLVIIFILLLLYCFKKKIVYENNTFYYETLFHKKKEFKYDDIKRIKYQKMEGVKVYMKNNKKFFINEQMTNFDLIFNKLKEDFWV